MNDIIYTCKNLRRWAKDETPEDIALLNKALSPKIRKDPLGAVLVIGSVFCGLNLRFSLAR